MHYPVVMITAVYAFVLCTASAIPSIAPTNFTSPSGVQLLSYIRRNPRLSREEFWDHWANEHAPMVVPLALKFGITGYTQIRAFGEILPQDAGEDNPASNFPTSFDGIATFRYPNDTALENMLAHPYYTKVVAVDEARFIDQEAHNGGQVAVFISATYDVVGNHAPSRNVWNGDKAIKDYYEALFKKYDRL
ncbi:hypothetical protein MCOR27_010070 [Pyricularia oryzae]|uniref:EthD domain-containing protein n=1 Tax=Pyricularia grisea TaxID=148305 RepID=A0ABQ8NKV7_PYRGI|nr:hypothetical protein MCOR01_000550 [Pyricularia oryzae]KAI6298679.1 hypothetical protein MCOR33_005254 [Pyricularia grisea]KAI6251592.1 hypothetical protein MCOR19_011767 [Pyricularia oryzae]KAI6268651.1 hypothetical protein MCOR27_010070 [Pyricularia oryzae]KAI6276098.1 hypothetical protein MCOR26_005758 [Pyricularia oryzae]